MNPTARNLDGLAEFADLPYVQLDRDAAADAHLTPAQLAIRDQNRARVRDAQHSLVARGLAALWPFVDLQGRIQARRSRAAR